MLVSDDDLEDYWRDLRPNRYNYTLSDLLQKVSYVSFGVRDPLRDTPEKLNEALATLPNVVRSDAMLLEDVRATLATVLAKHGGGHPKGFLARLVQAVRKQSRVRCRSIARVSPVGRLLEQIHDADVGPLGAFEEDFVVDALWTWADGFRHGSWGVEERALFNLTVDEAEEETEVVRRPLILQTRLLHLLLIGGVYELFERALLVLSNVEVLIQTDLIQGTERRTRAVQLDKLLEDIDHWNHHFSTCLTVVLGWSGRAEDAVLLRGLCEPLMQKIETSKFWLL